MGQSARRVSIEGLRTASTDFVVCPLAIGELAGLPLCYEYATASQALGPPSPRGLLTCSAASMHNTHCCEHFETARSLRALCKHFASTLQALCATMSKKDPLVLLRNLRFVF